MVTAGIFCADLAGLRAQALGLAAAAGLAPELRAFALQPPWSRLSPALWPKPLWAVPRDALAEPMPPVLLGAGGAGARVAAALRRPGVQVVAVQNPRMDLRKFDVVVAALHDGISGPNVIVTRTALHRVTPALLRAEAAKWAASFAPLERPLVAVLLGGSNGRYRLEVEFARGLARHLAAMMEQDGVGLMITGSRRTAPEVLAVLRNVLVPRGAWIWDGAGENPYFGMLGLAQAIIVTADSVSMVSEAVATSVPVLLVRLPGSSARIGGFMHVLMASGRVRDFTGRLELWDTAPIDDTAAAGAELRRRLGIGHA